MTLKSIAKPVQENMKGSVKAFQFPRLKTKITEIEVENFEAAYEDKKFIE